jgi:hypothetical protein
MKIKGVAVCAVTPFRLSAAVSPQNLLKFCLAKKKHFVLVKVVMKQKSKLKRQGY